MDRNYDILKHIADKATSNGTTIDKLLAEFTNSQCEVSWHSDYGNIWERKYSKAGNLHSRGHWWSTERVDAFSTWIHEEHIFDAANPRWK